MEAELSYYRRRSVEEAEAAAVAPDARVRRVHLDLARRYSDRIAALEAQQPGLHLRLVTAA
jgi:hypothetical protein